MQHLRKQLSRHFYRIMLFSILATILTWVIGLLLFQLIYQNKTLNPANYYESQIPELVEFVNEQEDVLNPDNQAVLEERIPLEGIDYQIVDTDGVMQYGSMQDRYIASREDVLTELNNNIYDGDQIVIYYPITDNEQHLQGAVGFRYVLSVMSSNAESQPVLLSLFIFFLLVPFVYIYLFTYTIGKRWAKRMEEPFNEIITGARKIENQDLNFTIRNNSNIKELHQLIAAFDKMKTALKEALEKQWSLEEDRREMVAAVAHDLKTPLTIIQGHAEGILESNQELIKRNRQYIETIIFNCQRSIRLIQELNDVSSYEKTEFHLEVEPTDVEALIQSKIKEYQQLCDTQEIRLQTSIHYSDGQHDLFYLDSFRINQMLDNILTNCLRYTPEQGVITWDTYIAEEELKIVIMDSGPGFSKQNKKQLFKKFFREDKARNSADGHSGLGLFIAKAIVEKHQGEISADNHPDSGAVFTVIIRNMKNKM
ncbi:HAMP domain-containing sensor histidine kinase [Oceanobacillus jeddahense]|uniref:HAMP domain-containing sensor histidine kinase n=1 Tax=Oceanobacillus jeddahense TaxID=1462527 RepID=UPI000595AAEA|nr:HAMP domain-containing sensor histidine kinase [Oceanobacillus jeddahense]